MIEQLEAVVCCTKGYLSHGAVWCCVLVLLVRPVYRSSFKLRLANTRFDSLLLCCRAEGAGALD